MASILSWAKKTAKTVEHAAVGMSQGASHVPGILAHDVQAGKGAVQQGIGNAFHDQRFAQQGRQQVQQNMPAVRSTRDFLQQNLARPAVQAVTTVAPVFHAEPLKPLTFHPGNRVEKGLLGDTPVQNIQAGVKSNYDQHPNLPKPARLGLSGLYGAGQVAQDAPIAFGAKNVAVKAVTSDVAKAGARGAKDVALLKPHRNISDNQLATATKVRSSMQGGPISPMDLTSQDVKTYRQVQQKLGAGVNDHKAVDDAIGKRMTWDTKQAERAQTVQNLKASIAHPAPLNEIGAVGKNVKDTAADVPTNSTKVKLPGEQTPATRPQIPGTSLGKSTATPVVSRFPARLLEDNRTEPIHNTLLQNVTHEVKTNKSVLDSTASKIAQNEDAALSLAKRGNSTEANATAMQLLNKYLDEGSIDKADELVKTISPRFTRQGQETQILAAFSKLQPAGAVRYAARQVEKNAAKAGRGKQLEDQTLKAHQSILSHARDLATQLEKEVNRRKAAGLIKENVPKTPEQMLADRIKTGVSQKKTGPDPIKDMVDTLHKVAKEIVPNAIKPNPRNPMELIGKAIKDKAQYADVWSKAQKLVAEKYKDNPHALEELDKYFSSSLARPFSKGQLSRGVQQGLKGTDLGKLVKEHYSKVDETGKDLKDKLIEQAGLAPHEATQLAADIQKHYDGLVQQRKDSIIKQMFGDKPKPAQIDEANRILQMHNLGALSRDEVRPLIAKKLGLQTLTKEDTTKISGMAKHIQELPEGSLERHKATFQMMDYIHKLSPSSVGKQAIEAWRSMLLTGVQTTGGNIVGNGVEAGTKQALVNPLATLFDIPTSLVTGSRSRALTSPKVFAKGAAKGGKNSLTYLKTGFDQLDPSTKYESQGTVFSKNLPGKVADKASTGVYRFLGAQDQPFRYGAREQALAEQAKVDGINSGLKGQELKNFVQQKLANPSVEELEQATETGARSVFGNDTILSSIANHLKQPVSINGKEVYSGAAGEFIIPFSKVPASIATRIVERSPLGYVSAAKDIVQAIRGKGFDQHQFTEKLANATVGTVGAAVVGKVLADHNMITLGYPTTNQKEQARWQAEGTQPYSIKLGGKWVSMNYVQPFGSILAYGAAYRLARKQGLSIEQASSAAAGEAAKSVTSQSFLQGVSGALNAVQDPAKGAAKYVEGAVSGVVPGLVKGVAKATDKAQRQVNNLTDAVEQGIPGLRTHLQPKVDVSGQDVPRASSGLNSFANPLKPSNIRTTPVSAEIDRLHNTDPTNTKMDVQPTPVDKTVSVEGNKVKLSDKQRTELQQAVGKSTYDTWGKLIQTDGYKNADDATKAKMLNNIQDSAVEDATRSYVVANNLGTYNKPESKKAVALHQGSADITSLAASKGKGGTTTVALTGDKRGTEFLNNYDALSSDRKKSWSAGPLDPKYKDVYDTSSKIRPAGMPDLPKKNTTLAAYADYLKANQAAANELERNKARGEFLKTAYKADISKPAQDLFGTGYTTASKIDAIKSGDISKTDLENAINLDNLFVQNGLTSKPSISKSVRAEFGYGTPSTGSGRRTTGRRKGSGRRVSSRKGIPTSVSAIKTPRINTKAKGFKSVSVKAPTFKTSHKSLPKQTAYKTPKVTKVA